jgi:hypothetical protein
MTEQNGSGPSTSAALDPAPPRGHVAGPLATRMLHAAAEHPSTFNAPAGPILASCPVRWRRRAAPSRHDDGRAAIRFRHRL